MKKPYNPIAILVYRMFKEFSNINHTCPYVVSTRSIDFFALTLTFKLYRVQ
ncbi:GH20375 [Drosophila grimshawi]|uniref:GH20375 n=1 Tax=Drosophila grimshawi TaxID=7222 RepID=B4J406_DROGR|nr:GH20375 [Drosophila grimshawi]